MPLTLRKQAAVARADGNQGHGKGEGVQRLASRRSGFMTRLGELTRWEHANVVRGNVGKSQMISHGEK
jgi:hypothetical protein